MKRLLVAFTVFAVLSGGGGIAAAGVDAEKIFPKSKFPEAEQYRLAGRILGDDLVTDLEFIDYLEQSKNILAPGENYFVVAAKSQDVNAFAYLGGMVVILSGLLTFCETEDEFLGVLAHEMGHLKLGHFAKQRQNIKELNTWLTPVFVAGLLIPDDEARKAVVIGSAGMMSGNMVAYSRELEHEADVFALEKMLKQGRNAREMAQIFNRFGSVGNEYISTHPAPARRNAYLNSRLVDEDVQDPMDSLNFYLLREKTALSGDVVERQFEQSRRNIIAENKSARDVLVARYGLLLLSSKARNRALGEEMTAALAGVAHPYLARAVAENLIMREKYDDAHHLLLSMVAQHPRQAALSEALLDLLIRAGVHQVALQTYNRFPAEVRARPALMRLAANAAAHLGDPFLSNYYLAIAYAKRGAFEQAEKQITLALRHNSDDGDKVGELHALKKDLAEELRLLRNGEMEPSDLS